MQSGRKPLVVADKHAQVDETAEGLASVRVPRAENRRTNQRNGDRHRLTGEQVIVRRKGRKSVVELINVSHGGAMVAGKLKAKLWDRVELVLGAADDSGSAIECAVRWIRGDRFGLEFAHETQVECDPGTYEELLRQVLQTSFPAVEIKAPAQAPQAAVENRAVLRHPLIWSGILHHDYEWEVVRLRNISCGGALIECTVSLPSGVTVYLDLGEAGRVEAIVKWSRGGQSGLEFTDTFDICLLSKATPEVAPEIGSRPDFSGEGSSDQSPWAPQWNRQSVDELGARLGD